MRDSVRRCLSMPTGTASRTVRVRVQLHPDGSLVGEPTVVGRSTNAEAAALAHAAVRAIVRCAPYVMPEDLITSPYLWTQQTLRFTSKR
jgi:colicin import membrane protein